MILKSGRILSYALTLTCLGGSYAWTFAHNNIDSTDKYAWSESFGWHNYAPTHGGVTVHPDGANGYLSGYAWAQNIGWIKLGAGIGPHANTAAHNYGVNMDANGILSGYAWSEFGGWINFNPTHSQVTINLTTGHFDGYAWSVYSGWIHFKNDSPAYNVRMVLNPVATPTFNPDGGAHPGSAVNVTVSCGTAGVTIHYTTNGNEPTTNSPAVISGGVVSVPLPGTLKAKAWKDGMTPSAVKSASYTATPQPPPAPVSVSASDGTYTNKITVEWTVEAGATGYRIYRHTSDNPSAAHKIGTSTSAIYDDMTARGNKTYHYWVKAVNAAGTSVFSAPDTGYLGVIGPLVTVNNMVGDNIRIRTTEPVIIAVEMMNLPAAFVGFDVDWWVAAYVYNAYAHTGGLWFYFDKTMNLTPFNGNPANCRPAYQGPLYEVPPQMLVENMFLAAGTYNIWFAVDYPMDGVLNLTPGWYLMDCVTVVVE